MKKLYLLLLYFLIFYKPLSAQTEASNVPSPNEEFRAVWITTVSNLDWPRPSERGNVEVQKASLIRYLDSLAALNLNAALLQVRAECDAFYNSSYEPWSRYLTGIQGADPGYDPLAFAIEEAHKRGIELHAWLNPYRINASKSAGENYYAEGHVYREHPEWALTYSDGGKILDPGLPQVQTYIKQVVGDILNQYDVDGIHFDDYFYSYSGTPSALDQATYQTYGAEYDNIGDFRRGSINQMIAGVWDTIQTVKPYVRFGVSPFGIYGNNMNPEGIVGLDAYNVIYCDPLAWLEQGTVDYITPQLYWPTGGSQDYEALLQWWADKANLYGRHVYAGHGIYRLPDEVPNARIQQTDQDDLHELKTYFYSGLESARQQVDQWSPQQIVRQVNINRTHAAKGALGSLFFRAFDFYRVTSLIPTLQEEVYTEKSLFPVMSWKSPDTPSSPGNLRLSRSGNQAVYRLIWDDNQDNMRYVIYVFSETQNPPYATNANRKAITYQKNFDLRTITLREGESIAVASLNRFGVESALSPTFVPDPPAEVNLLTPQHADSSVSSTDTVYWSSATYASTYLLELATDTEFTAGLQNYILQDTMQTINDLALGGEETYYWRVSGQNAGGNGPTSESRSFTTAYPATPSLTTPADMAVEVSLLPEIQWTASPASDSIQIQISEGGTRFNENMLWLDARIVNPESQTYRLEDSLKRLFTYYLRIRSMNSSGQSAWTPIYQFKTLFPVPEIPVFNDQSDQPEGLALPISLSWAKVDGATSYLLQVSEIESFDEILLEEAIYNSETYELKELKPGHTYYARIASRNAGGFSDFSPALTFVVYNPVLSIHDGAARKNVVFFPNPTNGKFTIRGLKDNEPYRISVYSLTGTLIFEHMLTTVSAEKHTFDLTHLSSQVCYIKITGGGEVFVRKLILN